VIFKETPLRDAYPSTELRVPALEICQGEGRLLYSFAVDGKLVPDFAGVSRIRRDAEQAVAGYQRPEVVKHIAGIREYLESDAPTIPNAIVLAFDSRVKFNPYPVQATRSEYSRSGELVIPCDPGNENFVRPGFVVDGQQRLAAIRDASIGSFPICVTAFVTDDVKEQTEQFILVNSTKPLPKGLIYELIPNTDAVLPGMLQRRRYPAFLLDRLNRDDDSPFKGLIQTPTNSTREENGRLLGIINHNAILKMIENSLSDGVLHWAGTSACTTDDAENMLEILKDYWYAARETFENAWGVAPKKSRLMHGAGIVSMGVLMDTISERYRSVGRPTYEQYLEDLSAIKGLCRWTDGFWDFGGDGQRKWNAIQNTSSDIQRLTMHLVKLYTSRVWSFNPHRTV
jgi:DGQHR domain-containing protein